MLSAELCLHFGHKLQYVCYLRYIKAGGNTNRHLGLKQNSRSRMQKLFHMLDKGDAVPVIEVLNHLSCIRPALILQTLSLALYSRQQEVHIVKVRSNVLQTTCCQTREQTFQNSSSCIKNGFDGLH